MCEHRVSKKKKKPRLHSRGINMPHVNSPRQHLNVILDIIKYGENM